MKIHYHTILEKDPNPENVHLNEVGKKITIEYDNSDPLSDNMEKVLDVIRTFQQHGAEISETASTFDGRSYNYKFKKAPWYKRFFKKLSWKLS